MSEAIKSSLARLRNEVEVTACKDSPLSRDISIVCDELDRLTRLLDSPELHDFAKGAVLEAAHQRERWGSEQDAGKDPPDWFWLIGYLAGKALRAHMEGDHVKALHHTISSGAVLNNWHAAILGACRLMRPGLSKEAQS